MEGGLRLPIKSGNVHLHKSGNELSLDLHRSGDELSLDLHIKRGILHSLIFRLIYLIGQTPTW